MPGGCDRSGRRCYTHCMAVGGRTRKRQRTRHRWWTAVPVLGSVVAGSGRAASLANREGGRPRPPLARPSGTRPARAERSSLLEVGDRADEALLQPRCHGLTGTGDEHSHGAAAPRGRPGGPRPARLSLAGAVAGMDGHLPAGAGRPARGDVDLPAAHRDLRARDPERGRGGVHARPRARPRHRRDVLRRDRAHRVAGGPGPGPGHALVGGERRDRLRLRRGRLGGGVRRVPARGNGPQPGGRAARHPPARAGGPPHRGAR